jgi:hypothetical protein
MIKTFFIFIFVLSFCIKGLYAQNGYSLEFEDVVLLSVDSSSINSISVPLGICWTKSYTVPANMVLKINAGHIIGKNELQSPTYYVYAYLEIDGKKLLGCSDALKSSSKDNFSTFSNDYSVWVPSGKVVKLVAVSQANVTGINFVLGWVSGVLYRKVPN